MPREDEGNQKDRITLLEQMDDHFSFEELREICFNLRIDPEAFDERRKRSFLLDLLLFCRKNDRLRDLLAEAKQKRPFISWPDSTEDVDLGLPATPFWKKPFILIPVGILLLLTIVSTLIVNLDRMNAWVDLVFPAPATPLPVAVAQPDELLIVIATFARAEGVADARAHIEIQHGIQAAAAELAFTSLRVEVVPDVLQSDERAAAEALGELYGASMVIWGSETAVRITTNFLNLADQDGQSGPGGSNFQLSVPRPDAYVQFITEDLPGQFAFLSLFAVGQSYYLEDKFEEAIPVLEAALANLPDEDMLAEVSSQAFHRLGFLYSESNLDLEKAIQMYDQAIAKFENNYDAYNNRGVVQAKLGNFTLALEDFSKAQAIDSQRIEAYVNRGTVFYSMGELAQAQESFDTGNKIDPANPEIYVGFGLVHFNRQEYAEAIEDYSRAIELAPELAGAYVNRGIIKYEQDDFAGAIEDYSIAISLDPDYAEAYYNRGSAQRNAGAYEAAVADYSMAATLDMPAAERAIIRLAANYYERGQERNEDGRYEEAVQDFLAAVEIDDSDPSYLNSLCWWGSLSGKVDEVIEYCEKAADLFPDNALIRDSRGLARALTGDLTGAIADFQFYVAYSKTNDRYEEFGVKREAWIKDLMNGLNPFDEATLAALRDE